MKTLTNEITQTIQMLPIEQLMPHPQNPRKNLGDLQELTDSIRENGILQNLTVVPATSGMDESDDLYDDLKNQYMVIIGHRRLAAAEQAGLTHVPCVVADLTEQEQIKTMLMENMQRSDLTILEQADGFQLMLDLGMSREEIAKESGFSDSTIRRRLNLRQLDRQMLEKKLLNGATFMDLIKLEQIEDEEEKNKVLEFVGTNNFEWKLSAALERQKTKKNLPKWLELIQIFATEITEEVSKGKHWKFERTIWLKDDPDAKALPDDTDTLCYGYQIGDTFIRLSCLVDTTDEYKKPEDLAREAHIEEVSNALAASTKAARELRLSFVKNHNLTKKQAPDAVRLLLERAEDSFSDGEIMFYLMDVPTGQGYTQDKEARKTAYAELLEKNPEKALLFIAYSFAGDRPYQKYYDSQYGEEYPSYTGNETLDRIYDFLESLGYLISDEERLLMSGKHPAYQYANEENEEEKDDE